MILGLFFALMSTLGAFDMEARFATQVTRLLKGSDSSQSFPAGIATLNAQWIFISDSKQGVVRKLDYQGNLITTIRTEPGMDNPLGIFATEDSLIAVVDGNNHQVLVMDPEGSFRAKLGQKGSGSGQLYYPKDVVFDPQSRTWLVSDYGNLRIQQYLPEGGFHNLIVFQNPDTRQFGSPRGLALTGKYLVAVYPDMNAVVFFSKSNLTEVTHVLKHPAFKELRSIASDKEGMLYVSDAEANSIHVLSPEGVWHNELKLSAIGAARDSIPEAITCDALGNLLISDAQTGEILILNAAELYKKFRQANLHFQTGKFEESLAIYEEILREKPDHPQAVAATLHNLEVMTSGFIDKKDWDPAFRALRATLRVNPSNKLAITRLRIVRWEANRDWMVKLVVGLSCLLMFAVGVSTIFFPGGGDHEAPAQLLDSKGSDEPKDPA